ncbi:MAG TPA: hypothetical protein VMZ73_07255 [Acidimicrobiales bacterium]|nr:hypothetical protein [Acidimicrobiales bacterium]
MRVRFAGLAAAALGTALLVGPLAGSAFAHERRTVGPVQMAVGWLNEPAYSGVLNAVQLRVNDDAGPITDVGDALKVELTFGDQKVGPLALVAAFGSPGEYRAALVPSRPGTYTFRFVGAVRGQQIDQSFTSSDKTFESPKETADIEFPVKDPSPGQLATRLDRIEPRVDQVRTAVQSDVDDAKSAANRATALAVVGLIVGVAGVAFGVSARRRPPRAAAPGQATTKAASGSHP